MTEKLQERLRRAFEFRHRSTRPSTEPAQSVSRPPISESPTSITSSKTSFPDGIKVLHDCPNAVVDICFIHGLSGNRTSTWTAKGQSSPWPQALLPPLLEGARIVTFGYDAYVKEKSGPVSSNRLIDHANNLLTDLTNDRASCGASSRPLIFVAHSLGGLVCKRAILSSRDKTEPYLRDIFKYTRGIVFMGTPHKGSWVADWARIPASALGLVTSTNKTLLSLLKADSELLESLNDDFLAMLHGRGGSNCPTIEISCFFEEQSLEHWGIVVSKDSATLQGFTPITIHADHRHMVRFNSVDDNGFKRVLAILDRWKSNIKETVNRQTSQAQSDDNSGAKSIATQDARNHHVPIPHYLPIPKNRNFVGRDSVLDHLERLLFTDPDGSRAALVGLGGMGKTQVALQLAHLIKKDERGPGGYAVLWVAGQSMASFEQSCKTLVGDCRIPCADDQDCKEAVRNYLNLTEKWLLVVDNVDEMAVLCGSNEQPGIDESLPDGKGSILFTTRFQDVAVEAVENDGSQIMDLTAMSSEDGWLFLKKTLIKLDQLQQVEVVEELLQSLTYLPLALAQASAYMNRRQISIKEYLRLLTSKDQNMIELLKHGFRDRSHYSDTQGAVATTWAITFSHIVDHEPDAATLLFFIAHVDSKAIPRLLLPHLGSDQKLMDAIGTLSAYSFLSQRGDSEIYDMHSLVHSAIRAETNQNRSGETKDTATWTLLNVFEDATEWTDRHVWQQCLPHALEFLDQVSDSDATDLRSHVSRCLSQEGQVKRAIKQLSHVVRTQEATLAEDHPDRLTTQHLLAGLYQDNGQIRDAIELAEHITQVEGIILAEDHPDRLATQHLLAGLYRDNGQIRDAIELAEHIAQVREILAEDHPHRLRTQHLLATLYGNDGQISKAIQLAEHVMRIEGEVLAEDHPRRLASQHALAVLYGNNGQISKAIQLAEHVVRIRKEVLAEDHPDRLKSQYFLTELCQKQPPGDV